MAGHGYARLSAWMQANFVRTLTERQGLQVGSPDEIAYQLGRINKKQLLCISEKYGKNQYGEYLRRLI